METTNPLLSRIKLPGETFRLPSGGLFYTKEEAILSDDVIDGEITIAPMTALDEIALKTPDLLFSGKAVDQVFARCIPQIKRPGRLLSKDVDFLLVCLRKVSYGPDMEITYTHTCDKAKSHSYIVNVDHFIKKSKRIDPTRLTSDFTVKLPNGQTVKMIPIQFDSYIELMQAADADQTPEEQAKRLYNSVSKLITSVDNVTDKAQIVEWLGKITPAMMKQITGAIDKTTEWGPDFMAKIKCKDCGKEEAVQAPLNPLAFFT